MAYVQVKRVFRLGLVNVVRNSFVSFSVIFVMTVSLFIVGLSVLFGQVMDEVTEDLRSKVDVTVYFMSGTTESQIFAFRDKLAGLEQVKEVTYVSKASALEEYRKRHENDFDILRGLDILESNPFRARLSIRAERSDDFEAITRFLENEDVLSGEPTTVIDKIDYHQNREIIARLSSVVDTTTFFTRLTIALLVFFSFLIIFNIMRLIMYLGKEEVRVMRLIGAEDWYVRSPFLISGAIYGFLGSVIAVILLYPVSHWLSPSVERFFGGQGLFAHYISQFFLLALILVAVGMTVGIVSSYLSTRRYLDE